MGLRPVSFSKTWRATDPEPSTPWPITFQDQGHSIAQNYVQHQDYGGGQYYHGGCDLRTVADSWAIAPVSGILEAGYYGYDTQADGQDIKWWKPWDGHPYESLYFEIAIVADTGYRYELHHVNPMNLPDETVAMLNRGGVRVEAGTKLAHVAKWPSDYDHVHFNIIRPDGLHMNPEKFSVEVTDHVAPTIMGAYAVENPGSRKEKAYKLVEGGTIPAIARELVVETTETRDGSVYVQTPPYFSLEFASHETSGWDFRTWLGDAHGAWVDIRTFFRDFLYTPDGRLENTGNYGEGQFLVRLPIPKGARGPFKLKVGDTAGNLAEMNGSVD